MAEAEAMALVEALEAVVLVAEAVMVSELEAVLEAALVAVHRRGRRRRRSFSSCRPCTRGAGGSFLGRRPSCGTSRGLRRMWRVK